MRTFISRRNERLFVELSGSIAEDTSCGVGPVAADGIEDEQYEGDEGCGAQRRGQRPEPQLPRPCRSGRSCGCRRIFGLCGGFQNAGFQTGRSLHFDAGSDGVEGCFRLAVEFGAGGTCFEMFQHFAANLCGGIVIEQQFDSVFKIGAFHGG